MGAYQLLMPLRNLDRQREALLELAGARIIHTDEVSIPARLASRIPGQLMGGKFFLEMASREGELARGTLARALTVFKLFKDNVVLSQIVITERQEYDFLPHYVLWTGPEYPPPPTYLLEESEESEFQEFWEKYVEIPPDNFAVSRFLTANYRAYNPTRFTDYIEALEYLFVPDSSGGEISYKFRLRGCLVLGTDASPQERRQLLRDIRRAYSLRSAIVHGNLKSERSLRANRRWDDILKPVREWSRRAILYFFDENCLDDNAARTRLLEARTIFEARVG